MERISVKDHGGPKCPSVVPFGILHSEGPFEVASFEHLIFTPKYPSEGNISHLESNVN